MYRLGPFQLDPRAHELRRNGVRAKIQEQSFVVLLKLVERAGELVTRADLQKAVWPADTFVDFEVGLNKIVKQLRQVLGDSADVPVFVETVPKLGYRFIGKLESQAEAGTEQKQTEADSRVELDDGTNAKARWAAIALVAATVVVAIAILALRKPEAVPPSAPEILPLTGIQGAQDSPAFSPDGNQVAFSVFHAGDKSGIYTTLIGGEKPLQLTNVPGDCCPAWSPDGRSIAFSRENGSDFAIYITSALGGTPRLVYQPRQRDDLAVVGDNPFVSWSPDGKSLALSAMLEPSGPRVLATVSLADGSLHPFTSPPPS